MKIQGKATITNVDISEGLEAWNNENPTEAKVQLYFKFAPDVEGNSKSSIGELVEDISDDLADIVDTATAKTNYSYLFPFVPVMKKVGLADDASVEDIIDKFAEIFVDKTLYFTVYDFKITELLRGTKYEGIKRVDEPTGKYTSHYSSYIGKNDDEEAVFSGLQDKLLDGLNDGIITDADAAAEEPKPEEKPKPKPAARPTRHR